jgi:hypothetical protein
MFIRVLQNDPNWHTLDCLPVPYAIDRKKLAKLAHDSEGHLPGLGESPVSPRPARGVGRVPGACWRAG